MKEISYAYGLSSRESVKHAAQALVAHLDEELSDGSDSTWTTDNFSALDKFSPNGTEMKRFHKGRGNEFLWDYIAADLEQGIYLVAESEKATGTRDYESYPLRHDFEKLLYVFAPIHLMICKAKNFEDVERIRLDLEKFAKGCSANFQAGSVFVLYCRVHRSTNVAYYWQAKGDPQCMSLEPISFRAF